MHGRPSRILAEPLLRGPVHEEHGLACRLSTRPVMPRGHRHDDVELALAVGGWVEHEHAGRRARVADGTLVAAWGALPHRVCAAQDGAAVRWLTVPLADALAWDVEGRLTGSLLGGRRWVLPGRHADVDRFAGWAADLAGGVPAQARAAGLEVRALLERLSALGPPPDPHDDGDAPPTGEPVTGGPATDDPATDDPATDGPATDDPASGGPSTADRHARWVATMSAFVATHVREPIGVTEIAAAAHLHPATATAAFRALTGTSPGAFLLRCRLAEAQRLLLVTAADVDSIARQAGFGSTSSFYACFTREVGEPPAAWRRRRTAARRTG